MLYKVAAKAVEQTAAQAGAEPGGGSEFIMHHILAQPVIKLPTIWGIDLTITNHVIMMWIASALLISAFMLAFRKKRKVPHGWGNMLESVVVYLRDDILVPNLGEEGWKYAPYLFTAFFFILVCNLLGLVPGATTATGDIGVTTTLALMTFFIGQYAGIVRHGLFGYFKHFIPPGLPAFIVPIMVPVEVMSLLSRHLALAIRLFANMIGGHISILAIMSIIFVFKSWIVAPFPFLLIIFSALLEILIALIQAYVFTILSAVFIGLAIEEEH